jgi:hypothetical protein
VTPSSNQADRLELDYDAGHERRTHRVRVVGAALGAVFLAAGLLGLLGGDGPLAEADRGGEAGAIHISYPRFAHWQSPDEFQVDVRPGGKRQGKTNIALSNSYLESVQIDAFSVEPDSVTALPDRTVFTFDLKPPASVTFDMEPQRIGRQSGVVYGPAGSSVPIVQWVHP